MIRRYVSCYRLISRTARHSSARHLFGGAGECPARLTLRGGTEAVVLTACTPWIAERTPARELVIARRDHQLLGINEECCGEGAATNTRGRVCSPLTALCDPLACRCENRRGHANGSTDHL